MVVGNNVGASALFSVQGIRNAVDSQAQVAAAVEQVQDQATLASQRESVNRVIEPTASADALQDSARGSFVDVEA